MEKALKTMNLEFCGTGKHKITAEKLFETKDVLFLDVRDSEEVKIMNFNLEIFDIPTLNIPIDQLPERLNELPNDKTITCFCSSGTRSAWAYIYLFSKGFQTKWLDAVSEDLAKLLKPGRVFKAVK
jgi:rhodanese-related sulfurtransferase